MHVFAPAIMDVVAIPCGPTTGYLQLIGPFQATTPPGERSNFRTLGPYPNQELAEMVATLKRDLSLPAAPIEVPCEALLANPDCHDGRLVRSRGLWRRASEVSLFAGARLVSPDRWNTYGEPPAEQPGAESLSPIDVVGLWSVTGAGRESEGRWPAYLDAYLLEVLPDLGNLAVAA